MRSGERGGVTRGERAWGVRQRDKEGEMERMGERKREKERGRDHGGFTVAAISYHVASYWGILIEEK